MNNSKNKFVFYVLTFGLIALGIFAILELWTMFGVKNLTVGKPETVETKHDYSCVLKIDYGVIGFEQVGTGLDYDNVSFYEHVDFDGVNNKYTLLFNDYIMSDVVFSAGKISGNVIKNFYDVDNNLISTSNVNFIVEFFDSQTKVTVSTKNQNDSLSYFQAYMSIHSAIVKVVETK